VFTELTGSGEERPGVNPGYAVSPDVRVRKESFGLLFYNTRNTKLTFVRSGDLLRIDNSPLGGKNITASPGSADRVRTGKLIKDLLSKGLILDA
jgi:putative mycofactocin binding protein MftB